MKPIIAWLRELPAAVPHYAVAAFILAGMLVAGSAQFFLHDYHTATLLLLTAVAITALPLCVELVREISKGNFSVDVLAILSIGCALVLKEYWVAAIVILMLSGGKTLEAYATRRASSVLGALARRMPQIAHRIEADASVWDCSIE